MMMGLRTAFEYFECAACGCLQIAAIPGNLAEFYGGDYYSFAPIQEPRGFRRAVFTARNRYAVTGKGALGALVNGLSPRLDLECLSRIPVQEHHAILDVGSGSGELLHILGSLGFTRLTGIDPFLEQVPPPQPGRRILALPLEAFDEPQDVVMFNHSLEHMPDQIGVLRHAAGLIRPTRGAIMIRVPLVSSTAWQTYGTDWVQLDAPRHLYLHSRRSVDALAARAGLRVCDIFYDSTGFQFWGSEQYRRDIPLRSPESLAGGRQRSLRDRLAIKRDDLLASRLNARQQGDQASFVLRWP